MSDLTLKGLYSFLSNYSKAREASNEAERLTNNTPGWSTNGYGDAARHAIASGLIARRVSPEAALSGGALHELLVPNESDRETDMDYRNNRFGVQLAPQFPSDEDYIRYIQGIPDRYEPRDVEGALSWYGKPKSSEMKKASGGTVKSTLQRYQESFPQRRAEANRQASVMSQADEAGWQPEYQSEPALEPPMISPDDLIGSGIPTKLAMLAKAGLGKGALAALGAGVIKNKGGNWLSGSVEGALSGLKKRVDPELEGYFRRGQNMMPEERAEVVNKVPINDWIDKQLTRYVKNEMATPEDPVRALAERGVLHFEPGWVPEGNLSRGQAAGITRGEQGRRLGKEKLAQDWEDLTDQGIDQARAEEVYHLRNKNPWLEKAPGDAPVYGFPPQLEQSLGFKHIIDELSNSLNAYGQEQELAKWLKNAKTPAGEAIARRGNPVDLPRHLQLDPKSLERVSVPQAIERVHNINLWRAAMKAEADQAKANNAATVLHKEYPEKGMKWVELRQPENPEGLIPTSDIREFKDASGKIVRPLEDALKYEGDTMGHCVGGYCDDVASGRSRIYSLRDAKGQPHVTIEVNPGTTTREYLESLPDPDYPDKFEPDALGVRNTFRDYVQRHRSGNGDFDDFALRALKEHGHTLPPERIVQIKGKQNRAPNPEYLPFVQDFVKSGKWSDVGDLQNAGLRRSRDVWNNMEQQRIREAGKEFGEYLSPEELKAINSEVWPGDSTYNFAHGGSVEPNNATLGSVSPNKTLTLQDLSAIISALESGNQHA